MSKDVMQVSPRFKYSQILLLLPGLLFVFYLLLQLFGGETKDQTLLLYKDVISLFNAVYILAFLIGLGLLIFYWKTNRIRERLLVSALVVYLFFGFILVTFAYGLASGIFDLLKGLLH